MQEEDEVRSPGPWLRLGRAAAVFACAAAFFAAVLGAAVFEILAAQDVPEGGLVESMQASLLALSAGAWFLAAAKKGGAPAPKRAFALAGFLALAMFVRELDAFFDETLWHGAWAAVDALVLAAAAAFALASPRRTLSDVADFAGSPAAVPAFCALFGVLVFSRLVGWKGIWLAVFDKAPWTEASGKVLVYSQNVPRHVKNVAEETFELFGYAALFASAVVPRALARRGAPREAGK